MARCGEFRRDEEGSLLIFGVYVFVMILMVAGIGIDVMHFERDRTEMQNTLDRAVLAAADLDQTQDPETVVIDYFEKSDVYGNINSITVDEGIGYRTVTATAGLGMNTQFMHMTGVDQIATVAVSQAEERIDGVEISMVLDVSGSMNSNNRLPQLKTAAKEFVDTMIDNSDPGNLSISIIPYATQVSIPDSIMNNLNVSAEHNYSNCINFSATDFEDTHVSMVDPYQRTMHFDPWRYYNGLEYSPDRFVQRPICENSADREMLVMQNDRTTLKNFIDGLWARGNTSIDIGMKWGMALLDPAFLPINVQMIAAGDVSADFVDRPRAYNDSTILKVVVLMSDGQNTSQYYINNGYRTGDSNVFWNDDAEKFSIWVPDEGLYFWPYWDIWADHPYGQDGAGCYGYSTSNLNNCGNWTWTGDAVRLAYPDLWAHTTLRENVYYNYVPFMNDSEAWDEWYYDVRNYVGYAEKDQRAYAACDAAKDEDVIVFTIAFEAPYAGRQVLFNCASSDSHYFRVDSSSNMDISEAFATIATSIRKLRLTQ